MTKSYTRRTPEQMVADLEAKIEKVKARAAAKEIRQSVEGKAFLAAVRALDKALQIAQAAGDSAMVKALGASRAPLSAHVVEMGIRLPDAKAPRKRRRKKTEAA